MNDVYDRLNIQGTVKGTDPNRLEENERKKLKSSAEYC